MKTKLSCIVLVTLVALVASSTVTADAYDSIVIGTGDPATDVAAVQAAVDQGGKVLLQGTFDFGEGGTVFIVNDVEIYGQRSKEAYDTKIVGGYHTFTVGIERREWAHNFDADAWFADYRVNTPVCVVIRDIEFERPTSAAIFVVASTGLEIAECKFFDAKAVSWESYSGRPGPMAEAVFIGPATVDEHSWYAFRKGKGPLIMNYTGSSITGDITVRDNVIDGNHRQDPNGIQNWEGVGIGIYVLYLGDGDHHDNRLVISGNEIRNTGHTSVVVSAAYGTTVIERNVLVPGGDNVRIGQGMFVREAGYFGEGNPALAKTTIANNTIIIDNDRAALWLDFATDAEITGNHIVMNDGMWASGIALLDGSTNSLVADNKIEGSANGAFALGYNWVAAPVEHNVYRGNNDSTFIPVDCPLGPGAHYALLPGANQNLVVGNGGEVIDLGEDNVITGLTKKPGNIGQMIKAVK